MAPEDIPLGYYTHINFAFALVNPTTFHIEDMGPDTAALYDRVSALKGRDPDLKVWIGKERLTRGDGKQGIDNENLSRWWLGHERPWAVSDDLLGSGRVYLGPGCVLRVSHHLYETPQL